MQDWEPRSHGTLLGAHKSVTGPILEPISHLSRQSKYRSSCIGFTVTLESADLPLRKTGPAGPAILLSVTQALSAWPPGTAVPCLGS